MRRNQHSSGKVFQIEETAKAMRWKRSVVLEEQKEGQCGLNLVKVGERSEVRGRQELVMQEFTGHSTEMESESMCSRNELKAF